MNQETRYWRANLTAPPARIMIFERDILPGDFEFIQKDKRWAYFLYLHSGTLFLNNRTYSFERGMVGIIPPGARAGHARGGSHSDTPILFMEVDMPGTEAGDVAMPALSHLPHFEWHLERLRFGMHNLTRGFQPVTAAFWNMQWCLSQPSSFLRANEQLYSAEDWIQKNIERQFEMDELASHLEVSSSTLLRLFRTEHGMTTQEYVRWLRAQKAKRMLVDTNLPIKGVAAKVGIHDAQQFNKLLRTYTGRSPKKLREEA